MQAKPDFISVKAEVFMFIKCGFLFYLKFKSIKYIDIMKNFQLQWREDYENR